MRSIAIPFWDENSNKIVRRLPYLGDVSDYAGAASPTPVGVSNLSAAGYDGYLDLSAYYNFQTSTSHDYLYIDPSRTMGFECFNNNSNGRTLRAFMQASQPNAAALISDTGYGRVCEGLYIGVISDGDTMQFCLLAEGYFYGGGSKTIIGYGSYLPQLYSMATHNNDPFNPYSGGGKSDIGGGDPAKQNWDDNSDTISDENLPDESTTGAVGTGFSTIFSPTKGQLQHLADVMWGNDIVSFLQNQVENIGSMFVSLGIVPFNVDKGSTRKVMWLGIVDTAIYLDTAAKQFYEIDLGTINLATDLRIHRTDSVFDYSPFSRLGIYLPFIGFQELDIDECRESTIQLKYKIDILSGSCVAWIYVDGNPIYQFSGNCLTQIPLSSQDAQTLFSNAVQVGIAAASAGVTGSVASAGDAMSAEKYMSGQISATQAEYMSAQHASQVSNAEGSLASATANGMMGMKPNYKRSGAVSASTSLISLKQPYLFLTTPREAVPEHYEKYCGFPSNITKKLGDLSGYTVVEDIRLNGLVATSSEVEEIYNLLKSGVII